MDGAPSEVTTAAHNCIAMSPDGPEMFCVYGARTKATGKERVLFVNRMEVQKDGTMVVYPPDTVTEHPIPSGSVWYARIRVFSVCEVCVVDRHVDRLLKALNTQKPEADEAMRNHLSVVARPRISSENASRRWPNRRITDGKPTSQYKSLLSRTDFGGVTIFLVGGLERLNLMMERDDPVLVGLDLKEVEVHVLSQSFKEWDPLADQYGQNRIADFVGDICSHACTGQFSSTDNPDCFKFRLESRLEQLHEIARMELNC